VQAVIPRSVQADLAARTEQTLAIFHRWGYAPTLEVLAAEMLGGAVAAEELVECVLGLPSVRLEDGFAYLPGYENLPNKSKRRYASNGALNGEARAIARDFVSDFVRVCPFVDCVGVSGSVASGGYGFGDDIDFDLFVRSGTKYTCYLLATLVGLKYGLRHRRRKVDDTQKTPFLPKITCVNVVWPENETRPFVRQDADLAFELMRCRPIFGGRRFGTVLADNPWLFCYFPQLYERSWEDQVNGDRSLIGRSLNVLARFPRVLRAFETASRGVAWILYNFVHWTRRRSPSAVARIEFLKRVKAPYEVFQD